MPGSDAVVDMNKNIKYNFDLILRYSKDIKADGKDSCCANGLLTVAWHLTLRLANS